MPCLLGGTLTGSAECQLLLFGHECACFPSPCLARDARPTWELQVKEPVAGNFFPLTSAMYIEEQEAPAGGAQAWSPPRRQLALVTDRAQGAGPLLCVTVVLRAVPLWCALVLRAAGQIPASS